MSKAKSEKEGGYFNEAEVKNWDDALNKHAKNGWRAIKSGTIVSEKIVIFWALLEKPTAKGEASWGEM